VTPTCKGMSHVDPTPPEAINYHLNIPLFIYDHYSYFLSKLYPSHFPVCDKNSVSDLLEYGKCEQKAKIRERTRAIRHKLLVVSLERGQFRVVAMFCFKNTHKIQ